MYKISIITVVFNNRSTIIEAIDSVKSQKYSNIEHIIIDGGSTDGTIEVLTNYKEKFDYFISEPDKGIYDAMNKGIRISSGDVIGFLNSDDLYYDSTIIKKIMKYFNDDNTLDIVYGDLDYVKSNNINQRLRSWKSQSYYKRYFENGHVPAHPSLFLKRKVYEEAGLFNLSFKLAADYEFMLRIFKNHDFNYKYISEIFVRMRMGGTTNRNILNIFKQNIEISKAWTVNNLSIPVLLFPKKIILRLLQFI